MRIHETNWVEADGITVGRCSQYRRNCCNEGRGIGEAARSISSQSPGQALVSAKGVSPAPLNTADFGRLTKSPRAFSSPALHNKLADAAGAPFVLRDVLSHSQGFIRYLFIFHE